MRLSLSHKFYEQFGLRPWGLKILLKLKFGNTTNPWSWRFTQAVNRFWTSVILPWLSWSSGSTSTSTAALRLIDSLAADTFKQMYSASLRARNDFPVAQQPLNIKRWLSNSWFTRRSSTGRGINESSTNASTHFCRTPVEIISYDY